MGNLQCKHYKFNKSRCHICNTKYCGICRLTKYGFQHAHLAQCCNENINIKDGTHNCLCKRPQKCGRNYGYSSKNCHRCYPNGPDNRPDSERFSSGTFFSIDGMNF